MSVQSPGVCLRVMTLLVCAAVAVGGLSGAPTAAATTYYVSQSAGNDGWSGQAASPQGSAGPWKTLARASTNYAAGDRVLLKCGDTWNEELHPRGSGTPAAPITIGSYGDGPRPVIDRQDDTQDRIGIHLADEEGYRIVGIEFVRCMTGIYAEYADGSPTRKHLWIEDCYFHDSRMYQKYEDYPEHKIGLGICLFSHERHNRDAAGNLGRQSPGCFGYVLRQHPRVRGDERAPAPEPHAEGSRHRTGELHPGILGYELPPWVCLGAADHADDTGAALEQEAVPGGRA